MEPISGLILGIVCAIIADSRGRNPLGWFFIGFFLNCIGLILVLVLPDLKVLEQKDRELRAENRRLREKIRRDRALADSRFSETVRRLDLHDGALQIDTSTPPPIAESAGAGLLNAQEDLIATSSWWYADTESEEQHGPVSFEDLQQLWDLSEIGPDTPVWCQHFENWKLIGDLPLLQERLDA